MMNGSGNLTDDRAARAARILGDGEVSDDDILLLRAEIFQDGVVERADAELIFHLDRHGTLKGFAWERFYVETLAAYFLERPGSEGVIGEEEARLLEERLYADGRIQAMTEFELLVRISERAVAIPERLALLVLHALKQVVIEGGGPKFGPGRRRPGVVDDADVDMIRKVIHGVGGDQGATVGRREAEVLFDINDAVKAARNSPHWQDLFVKTLAGHLRDLDAEGAAWLAERIRRDGAIHASEKALLAYLKANAEALPSSLEPLYREAGLAF